MDDRAQEWNGHNAETLKARPQWRTSPADCACKRAGSDVPNPFENPFLWGF